MVLDETSISTSLESKTRTRAQVQLENWKKRLIDFSKRNQLLYFKPRKNLSVEIQEPCKDIFTKLVIEDNSLLIKDQVQALNTTEFIEEDELPPGMLPGEELPDHEGDSGFVLGNDFSNEPVLQSNKDEKTLNQALGRLRTRSRASLSEHGINILYLALYFVEWYDKAYKETTKSPLLLVPVCLDRRGMNSPHKLVLIDDEITINPTLSYKMLNDYGIKLPDLDDNDLITVDDLNRFLTDVEGSISEQEGWKLIDESSLSLFSFAKLSMYKDLELNKYKILEHGIIKKICGDVSEEVAQAIISAEQIDQKVDANKNFQILDADSSQQEAIYAARAGQSFVLQGPPGTGKSQTIANIISESLAQNKKILFVSEKKAALDVVINRLKPSALDKFCFELHGSKQKKSDVISDLRKSLDDMKELAMSPDRASYLDDINDSKEKIQIGIDELHKKREPINKSLYELYGELATMTQVPDLSFNIGNIERITEKEVADLDFLFTQLEKRKDIINGFEDYIWKNASPTKLSFELENEIKSNFSEFQNVLAKLRGFAEPIAKEYFDREVNTVKEFKWLVDACKLAIDSPFPKQEWFNQNNLEQVKDIAIEGKSDHETAKRTKNTLLTRYSESYMMLNHSELVTKFTTEYVGIFKFLNIGYWKSLAQIKKTTLYNDVKNLKAIVNDLENAVSLSEQSQDIEAKKSQNELVLGNFYKEFDTNWEETLSAVKWVQKILNKVEGGSISSSFLTLISESDDNYDFEQFKAKAEQLILAWELVKYQIDFYNSIFPTPNVDIDNMSFEDLTTHLQLLVHNIQKIEDWIEFKAIRDKADKFGLKQFLESLIKSKVLEDETVSIQDLFMKKLYQLWVDKVEIESQSLRNFNGEEQQMLIDKFVDLDLAQINKVNTELTKKLARNWIEFASNPIAQEAIQVLASEVNKKRRHKPIRMLIKEISSLLLTLKPCWMMSPLTVSQLLDQNYIEFDIVIFDEASQIRTEDAIPSIYRAKQLVLAGDTHQLPPTNFFNLSLDEDDEFDEDHQMFDSVLDECSVFLNNRNLNWHYRSRHESLISFSNKNIYDNKLVTFPTPIPRSDDLGVHFEFVSNGFYERGARFNRNEAKRLAEAIVEHYEKFPEQSLGVIAFSEAQQMAIERELEKLIRKNKEIEHHFYEDSTDAFFVKNLENVQGDERDVIFFSIGYAKDKKGNFSHNFGPLNKEGGHRRLNVAVTRARNKLKVFSSITSGDIDLSRTGAKGAALLKDYLAYAQLCEHTDPEEIKIHNDEVFDFNYTNVEEAIAQAIESKGYKVKRYLGTSNYRIDLAIYKQEEEPLMIASPVSEAEDEGAELEQQEQEEVKDSFTAKFLLAIETDGCMYKSAATARDRERLRKHVLKSLGWDVHRVWARDWIKNPQQELDKILFKLDQKS